MMYGHITFTLLIQNIKNKKLLLWFIFAAWCANLDYLMPGVEHGGITHTLVYAVPIAIAGFILLKWEGVEYGIVGQVIHMLLDTPTETGIMWLYPFSTERFSLNLWTNTGALGIGGYYSQPAPLFIESMLLIGLIVRYHRPASEYLKKQFLK
ncbi:MAG: metal-dependent hydrolase [Candidatus Altiarchaeota archaeon]